MISKIGFVGAAAFLLQSAEAHVRFTNTYGNYNTGQHGQMIGYQNWIEPKWHGNGQWPGQFDTVVFGNPTIPACCWSPHKSFPRYWMDQGCGTNLETQNLFYRKNRWRGGADYLEPKYGEQSQIMSDHRNYHFFMAPIDMGAFIQTSSVLAWQTSVHKIAQSTPGGWLEITTYQVNADGAGPFRCRVDEGATSHAFSRWLTVSKQPPGSQAWHSVDASKSNTWSTIRVEIPGDIKCSGKSGSYNNICLIRCENFAQNGPFGGCVPVNVVYPAKAPTPKPVPVKPEPQPPKGDVGYNINYGKPEQNYGGKSGYWKERKRDIKQKKARRAANAAPAPVAEPVAEPIAEPAAEHISEEPKEEETD
ncbi:hypothetical protein TWF281_006838 [Arthrobotrys megalospora]